MKILTEKNLDALLITSDFNRAWLADYPSSMGYMFITKMQTTYFLDARYYTEASAKLATKKHFQVILYKRFQQVVDFVTAAHFQRLGYEDFYLTVQQFTNLQQQFPKTVTFVPIGGPNLRVVKTPAEVDRVERAIDISLQALHNIKPHIKAGVTEKSIDILLNAEMKRLGAAKESFDSIIASGWRGAIPHGRASDKVIEPGEWITIDFGALYQNYCADITRTFKLPGKHKNDAKMQEIFAIVREAQRRGIAAVRPGVSCLEIDNVCRDYIRSKGYEEYFGHGTGHGLGIEIHEEPYLSPLAKKEVHLEPGNIITVEPGIYIPGIGGVRMEDDILVTPTGHRQLGKNIQLIEKDFYD